MKSATDTLFENIGKNPELFAKALSGDKDAKMEVLKIIQKSGQSYLTDDEFSKQFESTKEWTKDRGDEELTMAFFLYGTPYDQDAKGEDAKKTIVPIIMMDWPDGVDKQKIMMGIGIKFAEDNPGTMLTTVTQVSEAWMVQRKEEEDIKNITPSESPDRIEVAIVSALSFDKRASTWTGEIMKDKDGHFTGYETRMEEIHDPTSPAEPTSMRNFLAEYIFNGYMSTKGNGTEDKKV